MVAMARLGVVLLLLLLVLLLLYRRDIGKHRDRISGTVQALHGCQIVGGQVSSLRHGRMRGWRQ